MAKARAPRTDSSSVTPINRKPNSELKKSNGNNGNVEEAIRTRAYEFFLQRGCEHGRDQEDWIRAEAEVLQRVNRSA